ncbi:glutathione S-transferase N-terminal domain-containing protein [Roseicella aquatilis]|uniref:Glutathione S-transferase n=1 Tax=Roseicella aquatilis TaxID=2527868 RepID=A0A4R4D8M0_9PROT|nr:glutathione S-transferase N-terminal domain-containing protein [Roseicella aquatilis]TCZ56668.1 glutathione S-transferase [Roseicella aquatilis]
MKLAYSPASPYVRKVLACAILRGLDERIELWTVPTTDPELATLNPLSKVPTLVTEAGTVLYDSPVICEYLDSLGSAPPLLPAPGPARWTAKRQEALADGILDATQPRRREVALPQDEGRRQYIALQQGKVARALEVLEAEAASLGALATIGEVALACALGYLDFRYPHEPWRPGHPTLEDWYARVSPLPAMARTAPPAA